MTRERKEEYALDRAGTTNRAIDDYRGADGMTEDNGKAVIDPADGTTQTVLHEIPQNAHGVVLTEIHAHDPTGAGGTFRLYSGTYVDPDEDNPTIDTVTEYSVPYNVGADVTRTIPYTGRSFEGDFISVTGTAALEIGIGVYNDHREYYEPATEQLEGQE